MLFALDLYIENMPKLMVHPQLLSLFPSIQDVESSEYCSIPHIISTNPQPFDSPPEFFFLTIDSQTLPNLLQNPTSLSTAIRRAKEDFSEAELIISTLGLKPVPELCSLFSKILLSFSVSFYEFKSEGELQMFVSCLMHRGNRPGEISAEEVGLRTKHKTAVCGEDDSNQWTAFLRCVPGVTDKKAEAVFSAYPTCAKLIQEYGQIEKKLGKKLLRNVSIGGQHIGEAVSTKVFQALTEQDETLLLK